MEFDYSVRPEDLPAPPTPDEVAAAFAVPLLTFSPQPAVEEGYVSRSGEYSNAGPDLDVATLSYTLWRNPLNHSDPVNLVELSEEMRVALAVEPVRPLPPWVMQIRDRMKYPQLWDAVRTTHLPRPSTFHTAPAALVEHVNYIVMNMFREERMRGEFPGELFDPAFERHIEHGVPVMLDGVPVPGMRLDTDPHVLGLAVDLGDTFLTAAVPRMWLPLLRLEFVTRTPTASEIPEQ